MKQHYREADLLEQYYAPGEQPDVALHLAGCDECNARFEALASTLKEHADKSAAAGEKPATFWRRQELAIMREIGRRTERRPARWLQFAAAAAIVLVVGALWLRNDATHRDSAAAVAVVAVASTQTAQPQGVAPDDALPVSVQDPGDPWKTESLEDFQSVVAWESWEQNDMKGRGTI